MELATEVGRYDSVRFSMAETVTTPQGGGSKKTNKDQNNNKAMRSKEKLIRINKKTKSGDVITKTIDRRGSKTKQTRINKERTVMCAVATVVVTVVVVVVVAVVVVVVVVVAGCLT